MALTTIDNVVEEIRSRTENYGHDILEGGSVLAEVLREVADELSAAPIGERTSAVLLDATSACVVGVGDDLRIRFLNQRARELLGEDAMNRQLLEVLVMSGNQDDETLASLGMASSDRAVFSDSRLTSADGETHIMEWHQQALPEPRGHVAVLLTGIEVTKRAAQEDQVRESELQLLDICNSLPALVAYVDAEERYQFNNAAYQWVLGLSPKDLKGRPIQETLDDKSLLAGAPHRKKVMAGVSTSFETQFYDREGHLLDALVRYMPHCDEAGEVQGFISLSTDISEVKRLEKALRHSQKMEALGRMASGSAHEFNNLMMGISGCANVALSRLGENDPSRNLLEEIRSASTGGASISRQLLNFSQGSESEMAEIDVDATISAHATMMKCLTGANIDLRLDLQAGALHVRLVQGQLEQLLMNLLVNARDAMLQGGELVVHTQEVRLDAMEARRRGSVEPGPYLYLKVSDSGAGMDAATLERIFDPFFTTKDIGGTGLGLSAVYGTVSKAGGTIEVDSSVGEGTTFSIWLPRFAGSAELVADESTAGDADVWDVKTGDQAPRQTVLLVEDDRLVRMTVRYQLASGGFHVIDADTGTAALERARDHKEPIALLVTDMVLPGVSGAEVAKQVRILHPEVRVMGMSAHSPAMLARAGNLGADMEIMQKPFTGEQLLLRVGELLEDRRGAIH